MFSIAFSIHSIISDFFVMRNASSAPGKLEFKQPRGYAFDAEGNARLDTPSLRELSTLGMEGETGA